MKRLLTELPFFIWGLVLTTGIILLNVYYHVPRAKSTCIIFGYIFIAGAIAEIAVGIIQKVKK